jgi:hypothetical protein
MLVAGMVGIFAAQAIAGWEKAGLISASGSGTEEVRIGAGAVNEVRFTCTQGSVTIKSIVVTTGAGEATVDVNESMSQGDTKDVSLRNHLGIRGMKVNHEGSGQYQVDLQ